MLHPADAANAAFQAACPVVGSIVRTLYAFPNKLRKLPPFRIFLAREGMLRDLPPAALIDWQRDVQNTARRNVHDVYQRVERLLRQLFAEAFRDGFAQRFFAFGVDLAAFAA